MSWDKTLFVGATFDEDDETITHQIIDRPSMEKQYISRLVFLCHFCFGRLAFVPC